MLLSLNLFQFPEGYSAIPSLLCYLQVANISPGLRSVENGSKELAKSRSNTVLPQACPYIQAYFRFSADICAGLLQSADYLNS